MYTAPVEHVAEDSRPGSRLKEFLTVLIVAALFTLPLRLYVARPFIVSGASMLPTFTSEEYLVIDELSYRLRTPKRGDVVVLRYPLDESKFFIKRIVGLPGEVLSVKNGEVSVLRKDGQTNEKLIEPYVAPETKKEFQVSKLADDEYFVMGDNRDESSDSRTWGPLPRKYIIGRVFARLYPFRDARILPGTHTF